MRQTEEILREYGEHRARFRSTCLYILPMDNPDGGQFRSMGQRWSPQCKTSQENTEDRAFQYVEKIMPEGLILTIISLPVFQQIRKRIKKKGKKRKPDATTYRGKRQRAKKETKALISFY